MMTLAKHVIPLRSECVNDVFTLNVNEGSEEVSVEIIAGVPALTMISDLSRDSHTREYAYISVDDSKDAHLHYVDKYVDTITSNTEFVFRCYPKS